VKDIAIPIYDGITALDAVGPYEVLQRLPGYRIRFLGTSPGPKRTDDGSLALLADAALEAVPEPEIVVVPGGWGSEEAMRDPALLAWLRRAHASTRYTSAVCTGSLILGAAGLLTGLRATTHWSSLERLKELGAEPRSERVVEQGKIVTAAGVSAGIDMALVLAAEIAGEEVARAIQLSIEYDPQPPFDAGSPAKAGARIVDLVKQARAHALAKREQG
jgi:putative intracellular protease/amidase